jgi:predicted GNAT family acetyltransferase
MSAPAPPSPAVRHLPERGCFEAIVDGLSCRLDYRLDGDLMRIHHTEVPARLEGRGIASALVRTAVGHARAHGLRIQPLCSYVGAWLRRHPEHADLLAR